MIYEVALKDIKLLMPVGLAAHEYGTTQSLVIDVIMDCQIDHNKHTFQSIDDCINYHDVMTYIDTHWKDKEHTELLETLAQDLLDFILNLPLVQTCQVIIHKPDIYNGQAIPSISIKQSKHV